jgi:hypothetical protein
MKKLFIITMLLLVSCMIYSQEYYPLVGENKDWNVLVVIYPGVGDDTLYWTRTYKFEGDTVINGSNYLKVYLSLEEIPVNWTYEGCIREDEEKRVYFHKWDTDYLKYDFGADIGDTVEVSGENIWPLQVKVAAIDSVNINGSFRKTLLIEYLDDNAYEYWIEGIGSNRGILQVGTANYVGGWRWLLCMTENDQLLYMNPSAEACYLYFTGINDKMSPFKEITLFPNPATSFITINIKEGIAIEQAIIYNHLGQKALVAVPVNNTVDVSGLTPGIYYLEVITSESRTGTKLVVE